jgi:hypothetical protein
MKVGRVLLTGVVAAFAAFVPLSAKSQQPEYEGCYTPYHGFATSVCTDEVCSTQSGVFNIVLRNKQAVPGKRVIVINGLFDGKIVAAPNDCGAVDAQHVLNDRDGVSSIITGPDAGCFTGGGDFVNSVEIEETLSLDSGTGRYANLLPGSSVTLIGRLGLKTGVNKFRVSPGSGDQVCFGLLE